MEPEVAERLAAALDDPERAFDARSLAELAPVLDALATLDGADPARVEDLRKRLAAALGARAAAALCDHAPSPARVAERFARLLRLLAAREAIAG